ncbi:hypothetical protein BPLS_P4531 [Bathymodiolus platifrons methanotrophic gill symbiont]|nr:hypothetical protein BPLS_P4531 [Bathymodiolus platifrons methanotrophic gill symbiont]
MDAGRIRASQILISPVKLLPRTWAWTPKMSFRKSRDSPKVLFNCLMMKRRCCVDWVGGCCLITRLLSSQSIKSTGAPCYLTKFRDSCRHNSFTYAADGRCPERPASATTTHKSRFVITTSLAGRLFGMQFLLLSRAASTRRISELPCRLSETKNHHFAKLRFHDFQRLLHALGFLFLDILGTMINTDF